VSRKSQGLPSNILDPALQEARLIKKVQECRQTKFYGTVTLVMQAGNLVRFETRQVEKLEPKENSDGLTSEEAQEDGQQDQEAPALAQQESEAGSQAP
jgi:hypothetical protein